MYFRPKWFLPSQDFSFLIKKNLRARKRGWYKYPIGNSILHFNKINEYLSARIWSRDSLILQISGKTFDILYGVPEHWGFKVQNCKGKIRLSKKPMLMPIQSTFTWNVFNQPKGLISLWQGKRSKINIKWKFYSSVNLQIEIWIESNICERGEWDIAMSERPTLHTLRCFVFPLPPVSPSSRQNDG